MDKLTPAELTQAHYERIKDHLRLITREEALAMPGGEEAYAHASKHAFPCYYFEAGDLNEGKGHLDEGYIDDVVFTGKRNPWNCALMLASVYPQLLDMPAAAAAPTDTTVPGEGTKHIIPRKVREAGAKIFLIAFLIFACVIDNIWAAIIACSCLFVASILIRSLYTK